MKRLIVLLDEDILITFYPDRAFFLNSLPYAPCVIPQYLILRSFRLQRLVKGKDGCSIYVIRSLDYLVIVIGFLKGNNNSYL